MVELEVDIVSHDQVHESVTVVISESRTNRHATVRNAGFRGDIRERAIPIVAKQNISAETRQVQIWPAVVVVVGHCAAHGEARRPQA